MEEKRAAAQFVAQGRDEGGESATTVDPVSPQRRPGHHVPTAFFQGPAAKPLVKRAHIP